MSLHDNNRSLSPTRQRADSPSRQPQQRIQNDREREQQRIGTRALIGRHSKDRNLSIFLEERKIVSEDGARWPHLAGLVTVDPVGARGLLLEKYVPYAEVQCILLYRTALGAVIERVVYNRTSQLRELPSNADSSSATTWEGTQPGRRRYPFFFDFGNDALPPSFCFDPTDLHEGVPIGLHWEVMGFLGQKVMVTEDGMASLSMDSAGNMLQGASYTFRRQSLVTLNFHVEHRHTLSGLALPPMTSTQTLRPSLFSFGRSSQPETTVTATLERPLCSSEAPLKVNVELTKLHKSHRVQRIRLVAKQIITIRLPTQQQLQYKANIAVAEDTPAPRYDPSSNNEFNGVYALHVGRGIPEKPKKGKSPARVIPLDWFKNPVPLSAAKEFVASTPPVKSFDDAWGLEVKYVLKVEVSLSDSSGTFGTRERELEVSLPFILTGVPEDEAPAAAAIVSPSRRSSTSEDTVPTAPDALLPLLSETLDDLEQSTADVAILRQEWRSLRSESTNCTRSSDHAHEILDILGMLTRQLKVFAESYSVSDGAVRWPKNPVPFNMLVLETELLARAAPDELTVEAQDTAGRTGGAAENSVSVVDAVLKATDAFFSAGKSVVLAWIASRGGTHDAAESEEFSRKVDTLENAINSLKRGLEAIVAGADQEFVQAEDLDKDRETSALEA
ncbi:uncharacterized protein SPPG_08476 [Spizellomyces punctatus DAOM BR117]|uniref:Uncharacterized protein n=1 Tax=Spizellomyces punctatus (strain DAOM BR117) TaxID=645134 RepID=A0A0L0H3Q4_SPIPD|nr:uncharacterized protein SPPG_08476 [Spizellomyces punctatus DAOM BR117]KNC96090.1 hypothetical protein SPPG_08476 [Spizellomyces punctatus DAOM BR117]|eukprot:XP_016604130.1 hypothetical protein SPPG_08476 [Spizellomyces punctatus DAOM BR117]